MGIECDEALTEKVNTSMEAHKPYHTRFLTRAHALQVAELSHLDWMTKNDDKFNEGQGVLLCCSGSTKQTYGRV